MNKGNIRLRALTTADLSLTLSWHNQEDIRDGYLGHPFPVNREKEEQWYQKILTSDLPTTIFGIEVVDTATLIGVTMLKNVNLIHREAEFAIYIGDETQKGRGYSKTATQLCLQFGFRKLNLNRIFLKVEETNGVAKALYERVGFVQEGTMREAIFKNGSYRNVHLMSVLQREFKEN